MNKKIKYIRILVIISLVCLMNVYSIQVVMDNNPVNNSFVRGLVLGLIVGSLLGLFYFLLIKILEKLIKIQK